MKKMFRAAVTRFLIPSSKPYLTLRLRNYAQMITRGKYANEQMDYLKLIAENKVDDWKSIRITVLSKQGSINEKNLDGVLLKLLINKKKFDMALSFEEFVRSSGSEINLGMRNGLLNLYYEISKEKPLTEDQKQFILSSYNILYEKHGVLDSVTCERLLHALSVVDEWKKAIKVLDDIFMTSSPTHSAFSTIIATLFNLNRKSDALKLIEKSLSCQRPLQHKAYEAWINYVLRKYKSKDTIVKYLEEICIHISKNCAIIPEKTAEMLKLTFASLNWHARFTRIKKNSGQCVYCRSTLDCLTLSEDEFKLLQKNVKDKLIVGSDILLKSSEEELQRFLEFVERTAPYDVVLDALNICYSIGKHKIDKIEPLTFVLEHFRQQNKKIFLLGRKHMLKWPKVKYLLRKTYCNFFTDDISQDDPYFITAAILSGSHTDFVSKDLLRGHRFNLQDEQLRQIFQRWQWQHQWKVHVNKGGSPTIQPPLSVTPCAQQKNSAWHLPFEREDYSTHGHLKDGTPDWDSWLCLHPSVTDS